MKRKFAFGLLAVMLLLASQACAKPQPSAPALAGAALKTMHAASEITLTDGERRLTAQKAADRWDVTLYRNDTVELAVADGLYVMGETALERVAPGTIAQMTGAQIDAFAETAVFDGNARLRMTRDYTAAVNAALEAVRENRDARLSVLSDALLKALRPESKVTVKQYKEQLIETLKASGEQKLDEVFEPGLFRLLERAAANGGALAETAAFFIAHRQASVNQTFLELLETLSPGGDPVRPETAVKVLIDTFYSKYFESSKYTLENLSADLGLPLYAYARAFEELGTAAVRAQVNMILTIGSDNSPTAAEVNVTLRIAAFPQFDASGAAIAVTKAYEDGLSGALTLA